MIRVLFFIFLMIVASCKGQPSDSRSNERYLEYKSEFDPLLTDHFPSKITSYPNQIIKSKNISKNDVGFLLYEYDVNTSKLDSLTRLLDKQSKAKYHSDDTCLFIVNRFETIDSYENRKEVIITDSSLIDRSCYKGLFPVPNFINYRYRIKEKPLKLNDNFVIYVVEAKSGKDFKEFGLNPSPQMPSLWRNGYSKGIAMSLMGKTVIYWGIIW